MIMTPKDRLRFWDKVLIGDGCWQWQANTIKGYGQFFFPDTPRQAHRVAYEDLVGPIPEGLTLDHLCHNADPTCNAGPLCLHRSCVNPAHLEPVPSGTNTLRGRSLTAVNARKTHCINGHPLSGDNLYIAPSSGERQCVTCKRETTIRRRRAAGIPVRGSATHCSEGHLFDYFWRNKKYCLRCRAAWREARRVS